MEAHWSGVFPAVTTKFTDDFRLDYGAMERHFAAQIDAGVHGLIVCGSLGESSTLAPEEKLGVLRLALMTAVSGAAMALTTETIVHKRRPETSMEP